MGGGAALWGGFSSFFSIWQLCILQISPFFVAFITGLYLATLSQKEEAVIMRWVIPPCITYTAGFTLVYSLLIASGLRDTTTGIVTWVADGSQNVTNVSIAASAQVTLASAISGLAIGGRLYLTSVGGTVGTVLNNLAHPITNIAGSVYTISTSTVGLAYTSGGLGAKYAQPTESLDWSGEFDVPVRFESDSLPLLNQSPQAYRAEQVVLLGIRT